MDWLHKLLQLTNALSIVSHRRILFNAQIPFSCTIWNLIFLLFFYTLLGNFYPTSFYFLSSSISTYLYLCHNDNTIDPPVMHLLDSKAHTDYSNGPNAMEMHMSDMSTGLDLNRSDTNHDMSCTFVLVNHRIVSPNIPCKGHHPA